MLLRLQIQNFALIQSLTLEFDSHLNVLTGETGAGKSILIDALCFALGERYEGQKISAGKNCSVEAVFEVPPAVRKNEKLEPFLEDEEVLILRREITPEGKNRVWINNRTATNAALKDAGTLLINIHGQHDHQLLLDPASHMDMVDRLAKNEVLLAEYRQFFAEYDQLLKQKEELAELTETREREIDLLKYQIKEIEGPAFQEGEEDELKVERIRLANAEKLHGMVERVLQSLNDHEDSVSNQLSRGLKDMSMFVRLDASMENLKSDLETAQLGIEETIRSLRDYQENLSFDADRLEEIDKRTDQIELVKRKYGGSLTEALKYLEEAKEKFDKLTNSELYSKEAEQKIKKVLPKIQQLAGELTDKRKKTGLSLKRTVEGELKDLNIASAVFECGIEKKDFSADGADQLEFRVSLNPGQPVMALRKVISGGEASRVMLAMKKALMKVDPVPTLIFDEIDANIGGRLGSVTGEKLKEIAGERQVLLITHLPQIASFADRHFKVTKKIKKDQTVVEYDLLEGEERVRELAQMMSGKNETEIAKKHAEEMLSKSR